MQINLHEENILQIHNTRPELVNKISWLLINQNPAFLYKVYLISKSNRPKDFLTNQFYSK